MTIWFTSSGMFGLNARGLRDLLGQDVVVDLELVVALERQVVREHAVQDESHGEEVCSTIQLLRHRLFGRHVEQLALDHAELGVGFLTARFRHTEVDDLHVAGIADEDVVRRDIAVNDIERAVRSRRTCCARREVQRRSPT